MFGDNSGNTGVPHMHFQSPLLGLFGGEDPLRQMERLLSGELQPGQSHMGYSSRSRSSGGYNAAVDIEDKGDHFRMTADLPGVAQDDVNLTVHDTEVCLSAKRAYADTPSLAPLSATEDPTYVAHERRFGSFERCFGLPSKILEDKTTASMKDGVLTVQLAKGDAGHKPIKILALLTLPAMPPAADSLLALADSGNVEALRHRVEALLSTEGTAALNASVASHRLRGFNAGLTPLMAAAKSGHSEAVQVLLDAGADPNAVDEEKWNALHYACFSGHASIAADLLHRGTDTALRTTFEKATPLDFASHRKFSDTVAVLGGEAPEPYTPSSREAVLRKGLTKLAGCRPAADGTYLLLHRYRVSPASHAMWLGYLQSGAQAAVRIPASDEELGTAVDILMYPSLPRPDVPGVLRHSSVSGLQHITVVRSGP